MGRVVDFSACEPRPAGDGVTVAAITNGETREFSADLVRVPAGKSWSAAAPAGSDLYLFTTRGAGTIVAGSYRHALPEQAFATIGEGVHFTLTAAAAPVEIVAVTTPPKGTARAHRGFQGAVAVLERARQPVIDVPEQKKTRVYFCGHHHGTDTERGHAMIVGYVTGTETALHHHPNAESLFVMLDGACQFTVNGKPAVARTGQAAYFGIDDKHGLVTAPGESGASFLEFHIPAAFTTVKA